MKSQWIICKKIKKINSIKWKWIKIECKRCQALEKKKEGVQQGGGENFLGVSLPLASSSSFSSPFYSPFLHLLLLRYCPPPPSSPPSGPIKSPAGWKEGDTLFLLSCSGSAPFFPPLFLFLPLFIPLFFHYLGFRRGLTRMLNPSLNTKF